MRSLPEYARRRTLAGLTAMALLSLTTTLADAAAAAGKTYTLVINNMAYGAAPANLKVGDTITWVNRDTVLHSVTARDHSFDIRLNPGQSAAMVLRKSGSIPFYCLFHPTMRGTLKVGD